jgi:Bacteriophage HK97-gp10, putative tail-component
VYYGGKLAPWFDTSPNRRACERMADKGGERMTTLVKQNTPVHFGTLRASITQKLTVVRPTPRGLAYESGAETEIEYAPYVEHGTGLYGPRHAKYEIRPKNPDGWLRWIDRVTGEPVFAKRVMHPGSPGNHMFAIGAALTEHEFEQFAELILTRWSVEVERQNRSDLGMVGRL